ncbi:hypothetical protein B4135_1180 [Caldibacillus debilis]|uniref:Uncharacterized protein n=1 Tax=Caldibacillus debilis TaxID=301148 RepID=A0A150MDR6_9BACI|nr:hypothetical protein B4135_1180 [Caldibacillus debilis]
MKQKRNIREGRGSSFFGNGKRRPFRVLAKGRPSRAWMRGMGPEPEKKRRMVWGICAGRRRKKDAGPIGKVRRRLRAKGFKRGRHRFEWESRE